MCPLRGRSVAFTSGWSVSNSRCRRATYLSCNELAVAMYELAPRAGLWPLTPRRYGTVRCFPASDTLCCRHALTLPALLSLRPGPGGASPTETGSQRWTTSGARRRLISEGRRDHGAAHRAAPPVQTVARLSGRVSQVGRVRYSLELCAREWHGAPSAIGRFSK